MSPITETAPHAQSDSSKSILDQARAELAGKSGRTLWRNVETLLENPRIVGALKAEYPRQFADWDTLGRRDFIKLMGASLALAGFSACTKQPTEKIIPYVTLPEDMVLGNPVEYATAIALGGFGIGVLAESHQGRPTKLEGNPEHPSSLGSTDTFTQAAILSLYDMERSKTVLQGGKASTWEAFVAALAAILSAQKSSGGAGIRILTETVTSPTQFEVIKQFMGQYPSALWHQYEPVNRDNILEGALLAFGEPVETLYHFDQADVVLSIDSDFMTWGPGRVRYSRDFASRRTVTVDHPEMNRLYVAEAVPSCTGSLADHRLPLNPRDLEILVNSIAHGFGINTAHADSPASAEWVHAVVEDLKNHPGKSIVIAGPTLSPAAHALVHTINETLGNSGKTVVYSEPIEALPVNNNKSLASLVADMAAGKVEALVVLSANPVYTSPANLAFSEALSKVKNLIHLGAFVDETGAKAQWHIPESHALETWGDIRGHDGTVTLMQPLIDPLYDSKSALELLSAMLSDGSRTAYDLIRNNWLPRANSPDAEGFWRRSVHDGHIANTAAPVKSVTTRAEAKNLPLATPLSGIHVAIRPDAAAWDGRFASNAWLQETPRPLTKLVWDNAALISPAMAAEQHLENGDVVTISVAGRTVDAPVWKQPGMPRDTVVVQLGYGRRKVDQEPLHVGYGSVSPNSNPLKVVYGAEGAATGGFNAYALRTADAVWTAAGATLTKTGRTHLLVSTQDHDQMEGRHQVRHATLAEFHHNPDFVRTGDEFGEFPQTQFTPFPMEGHQWAMSINLNTCNGCNACMVACQSENNIPVVGKDQVANGREMHWIRMDRYYEGTAEAPLIHNQPVPCMHCENAPCEQVCPVAATTHDNEGINQMVYNRCVGTRYCSNNCPYKVRRFNYYKYSEMAGQDAPVYQLQRNPDVTVRARGVMEKCTYCVQRISGARITAKKDDRSIREGEVLTACQQACPTRAIVFGNMNDPDSAIARARASSLDYALLSELNARPRTTYLGKIRNVNPTLALAAPAHGDAHHEPADHGGA